MTLPPLTILEEFLLLALDDQAGTFWSIPRSAFDCATATAVLMDLMRTHRIDCDATRIFVTDTSPVGDDILDPVLQVLALDPVAGSRSILDEIRFLSDEGEALRDRAMARIGDRGVAKPEETRVLWVFGAHRYPVTDDKLIRAVKLRVIATAMNDEVPDPRDAALVALADACGLFRTLLSAHELSHARPRLTQVARLDPLGRVVAKAVADIEASIALTSGLR